jgi:hypothetical protein
MKKAYEKPTLVRRVKLPAVTANSNHFGSAAFAGSGALRIAHQPKTRRSPWRVFVGDGDRPCTD